jgi:hypothetical protein
VQREPVERGAERLVVRERVRLERLEAAQPLRPGGRGLARDRGAGEVALRIPLRAFVGDVVVDPDEATAAKVLVDAPGGRRCELDH